MQEQQILLDQIQHSRWYRRPQQFDSFYGNQNSIQYGLFVPGIERFMLVDNLDLWSMFYAARLLSSKFQSIVFPINPIIQLENHTCLNYGISRGIGFPMLGQVPVLKEMLEENEIHNYGFPRNELVRILKIVKEQEYCLFVLRAAQALKVVNAIYSNVNNDFYSVLFPELSKFTVINDETLIETGFAHTIEKILYLSENINQALVDIRKMFDENQKIPYFMKQYKEHYYELLGLDV